MPKLSGMTLTEWLEQQEGRASALARHCGVSDAAVSQWKASGVPLHQIRRVVAYTNGDLSQPMLVEQVLARAESRAASQAALSDGGARAAA